MDANNLNTISSSKYDIYTKLLNLAASGEYITDLNNIENIDFLKSGLFGYVTESLAMLMRDSSFHKTMVYRENFLNTAIMPKSIYNWAKMFSVNVLDAVPSARRATISLDINTIETIIKNTTNSTAAYKKKYGISEQGNFMVIDKSNPIIAGSYYFMLEHSLEIWQNAKGQYIVKYCLNEEDQTTNFGTYSNGGLITTVRKVIDNKTYLFFDITVFQYKVVEKTKIISGSTYLDTKVHQFEIAGQICGLTLKYQKSDAVENVLLKFSNLEINEDALIKQKVAYYSIIDKNILEISFLSNKANGLPQAGGTLTLTEFITEGFNGNINFTGEAVFLIKQDDIKSLPILVSLSKTPTVAGLDQTQLGEIKTTIINKLATRNTIITENDLNTWFASQSKVLSSVNNSEITFKKEVDTILRRTFSAYLLLRDGVALSEYLTKQSTTGEGSENGQTSDASIPTTISSSYLSDVVPTNTIDIYYKLPDSYNDKSFTIDYNKDIIYKVDKNIYEYTTDTSASSGISISNKYKTPFVINLNTDYNILSYYYLETSDSSEMEYSELKNKDNKLFLIPISMEVFHQNNNADSTSSPYEFKFYFASDSNITKASVNALSLEFGTELTDVDPENFEIESIDNEDNNEAITGVKNYVLKIYTTNTDNNQYLITNDSENPQIKLSFKHNNDNSISVYESTPIRINLQINNNSFNGSFQTVRNLNIFKSLNDIMFSDVIVQKNDEGIIQGYTIKDVPVVASYWINSSINKSWFIKQLFIFINMLKSNLDKLETTTFFNIKFRNTYGISQYFSTTTTMLRLKLKIYLKNDAISRYKSNLTTGYDTKEALQREIIDYIRVAVDRSNASNALVISKIIMQTQAAYINFIDHIDFLGLNGTFNQYVQNISDKIDNKSYPLEYFSLDNTLEDEDNTGKIVSRLEKDITFEII